MLCVGRRFPDGFRLLRAERTPDRRDRFDPLVFQEGRPLPVQEVEALAGRVARGKMGERLPRHPERLDDRQQLTNEARPGLPRDRFPIPVDPTPEVLEVREEVLVPGRPILGRFGRRLGRRLRRLFRCPAGGCG